MDEYTIEVKTHPSDKELSYQYSTNRGAFAAIHEVMLQFSKDFPLSDAWEVTCRLTRTREGKTVI